MVLLTKDHVKTLSVKMKPAYDTEQGQTTILHFGPSRFFLGHWSDYAHQMAEKGHDDYKIAAISLRTNETADTMSAQNNLYSLTRSTEEGLKTKVLGSVSSVASANGSDQSKYNIVQQLSNPNTKIVSMTITQGGYYYKNGGLMKDHPDIDSCLHATETKDIKSSIGFLAAGLHSRFAMGMDAPLIMSLDNMTLNGDILRRCVVDYAAMAENRFGREFAQWIEAKVVFPNTMVDRIVSPLSKVHQQYLINKYGFDDGIAINTEQFKQLVIEKNGYELPQHLYNMEKVGVQIVDNVKPYEKTKIRILNGSHMAIGTLGYLALSEKGQFLNPEDRTVYRAMQNGVIANFMGAFMKDTAHTLRVPPLTVGKKKAASVEDYIEATQIRLSNKEVADPLNRLARNGTTQKLHERIIEPMKDLITDGRTFDRHLFSFAAWVVYVQGVDFNGQDFDVQDDTAKKLGIDKLAAFAHESEQKTVDLMKGLNAHNLLGESGKYLEAHAGFTKQLHQTVKAIKSHGVTKVAHEFV